MAEKRIETLTGEIRTPVFVYILGFSMIFYSLFTIDFGESIKGLAYLAFLFEYGREIGLIKFALLSTLMRCGFDVSIFGILWKIAGYLGYTNEDRHYVMLFLCFIVSISIIKLANWNESLIDAFLKPIVEIINLISTIL